MSGSGKEKKVGGLAGWLLNRLERGRSRQPRLELLERITLAPRQTLSLVEAEGRRFLVASSVDGSPSFYPLDGSTGRTGMKRGLSQPRVSERVSW
jgi:flagellar biogenesis protein FliO